MDSVGMVTSVAAAVAAAAACSSVEVETHGIVYLARAPYLKPSDLTSLQTPDGHGLTRPRPGYRGVYGEIILATPPPLI